MLILITKFQFLIMKHIVKYPCFLYEEDINIEIVKLIVLSKELICDRYFINVTNNSKLLT